MVAWASDKMRHRFLFTFLPILVAIAGFAILLAGPVNKDASYGVLFIVVCGTYSAMPVTVCWFNMNLGGHHCRSVGSAWQIGFGNIGGIIATFAFLPKDAPQYIPGYSICIAFICLSAISCLAYFLTVWSQNKHRAKLLERGHAEEKESELGDMAITYRYQL